MNNTSGGDFNGFLRCPNCRNIHTLFGHASLDKCHDCNASFQDNKNPPPTEYQSSCHYLNEAKESSHRRIVSWDYRKPPPPYCDNSWSAAASTSTFDATPSPNQDHCKTNGGGSETLDLLADKRNISANLSTNAPPDFTARWKPLFRKLPKQELITASQRQFGQPLRYQPPPPRKHKNDTTTKSDKLRRYYMPISGGVNFILCYKCLSLLQIPKRFQFSENKANKMRCGNPRCSKILSFSLCRGTHVMPRQKINSDRPQEDETEHITKRNGEGYTNSTPTLSKMIGRYSARDILFELSPDGSRVEMISARKTRPL